MKRLILGLFTVAAITVTATTARAQAFSTPNDTVFVTYTSGSIDAHNDITAIGTPSKVYWKVTSTNFPATWSDANSINICDNVNCWTNAGNSLLNGSAEYLSDPYLTPGPGLFKATFNLANGASGTHYVTFALKDSATNWTKPITFVVSKAWTTGVNNVNRNNDEVTLYPNPATDDLNVVFGANDGIKNIAVFNVIGKAIVVYKVAGNSAKMDISRLPNGVYFLRMSDAKGQVVSTKRFTKQ